jgi:hypothetical protein
MPHMPLYETKPNKLNPPYSPELIAELESDIGVPNGFFSNIIHEDDWSFIVKLHGMVEAGLTQLIVAHFGDARLEVTISKMNISGPSGKLAIVRALELLPKHNINFIQKLNEMRNLLVHRISNVGFSIDAHFRSLDPQQLADLIASCGDGVIPDELDFKTAYEEQQKETFFRDPRKLFWWSSVWVLGNLAKSTMFHSTTPEIAETERKIGRLHLGKKEDPQSETPTLN